jgi:hypothetical protein
MPVRGILTKVNTCIRILTQTMATSRGPDNSVRIAISGTQSTQNWANIFRCQLTTSGSISQADLDTWTAAFAAAYKSNLASQQTSQVTYVLAKAVLYTPGGGALVSTATMTGSGTSGGTNVSDISASICLSWLSTVYWRGGKPRSYMPGVSTAQVTNNYQVTPTTITGYGTAAAAFRTAINALTATSITGTSLGFVSFNSGNAPRGTPLFFAFSGVKIHGRLATQRRRLGRWLN